MKREQIEVIEIADKDALLIKSNVLNTYNKIYLLNGEAISEMVLKNDFIMFKSDKLQSLSKSKELIHYKNGENIMDVETYKSKPTYYDDDSTDEQTLRAIANKKELNGYEAIYKEPGPTDIEFKIVGAIIDTESKFITTTIYGRYSNKEVTFSTEARSIAIDEYRKLSEKYSEHGRFQKPDRNNLRFVQINGSYAFGDSKPFGDRSYWKTFTSLEEAKKEEEWARKEVRAIVERYIFDKDITTTKKLQILDNLKLIRKLRTLKSKDDSIDVLIKDLADYLKYTK